MTIEKLKVKKEVIELHESEPEPTVLEITDTIEKGGKRVCSICREHFNKDDKVIIAVVHVDCHHRLRELREQGRLTSEKVKSFIRKLKSTEKGRTDGLRALASNDLSKEYFER